MAPAFAYSALQVQELLFLHAPFVRLRNRGGKQQPGGVGASTYRLDVGAPLDRPLRAIQVAIGRRTLQVTIVVLLAKLLYMRLMKQVRHEDVQLISFSII